MLFNGTWGFLWLYDRTEWLEKIIEQIETGGKKSEMEGAVKYNELKGLSLQ